MNFKPQDTFSKFNEYLGGLVLFTAFYLEHDGIYMTSNLWKTTWELLASNTTGKSFSPHNTVDLTMSYHYVNFSIRFILQPKKFEYWKYMISAFYNSSYDPAISYDCEDNGLIKAPMYWSFFLYENTV